MSMSLRDQLLAAGLVSQKQVRDAERQQQHQERAQQQSKQKRPPHRDREQASQKHGHGTAHNTPAGNSSTGNRATGHLASADPAANPASAVGAMTAATVPAGQGYGGALSGAAARHASAQSAKVARDLALNKKQQEKAEKKARAAQIRQLIEQNRVQRTATDERYNFVDGDRVRFIAANAEIRARLIAGELFIVRHDGVYEVVSAATAARIRERDERSVINAVSADAAETPPIDDAYKDFAVPDDLMW